MEPMGGCILVELRVEEQLCVSRPLSEVNCDGSSQNSCAIAGAHATVAAIATATASKSLNMMNLLPKGPTSSKQTVRV